MNITRRSILFGMIAAPIVVRSGLVMPIRALDEEWITVGPTRVLYSAWSTGQELMVMRFLREADMWSRTNTLAAHLVLDTPLGQY